MGITDAIEDGVEVIYHFPGGYTYRIPCELCGKKIRRTQYSRKRTYICDYCKGVIKEKKKIEIPDVQTPHEKRFEKAVKEIEKTTGNLKPYKNAISIAKTRCERYGSVPEAMVAIELIKLKYKIIPQQKIDRYTVDFALPDEKMIIEVDGELFHPKNRRPEREARIQFAIGLDWKIIHIPAEPISKNITKLQECINALRYND